MRVIWKSEYLLWVLLLVLLSQITVSLIDYQYKGILQDTYSNKNDLSAFQGWMYLSIDVGSLILQLFTGVILIKLGIGKTLNSIPILLGLLFLLVMFTPGLLLIAITRSASKFLTYSIFKTAKELFYVPLSYKEQTQGKAIIDIMIYRQAKILASILLLPSLGVISYGAEWITLCCIFLWIMVSVRLAWSARTFNFN